MSSVFKADTFTYTYGISNDNPDSVYLTGSYNMVTNNSHGNMGFYIGNFIRNPDDTVHFQVDLSSTSGDGTQILGKYLFIDLLARNCTINSLDLSFINVYYDRNTVNLDGNTGNVVDIYSHDNTVTIDGNGTNNITLHNQLPTGNSYTHQLELLVSIPGSSPSEYFDHNTIIVTGGGTTNATISSDANMIDLSSEERAARGTYNISGNNNTIIGGVGHENIVFSTEAFEALPQTQTINQFSTTDDQLIIKENGVQYTLTADQITSLETGGTVILDDEGPLWSITVHFDGGATGIISNQVPFFGTINGSAGNDSIVLNGDLETGYQYSSSTNTFVANGLYARGTVIYANGGSDTVLTTGAAGHNTIYTAAGDQSLNMTGNNNVIHDPNFNEMGNHGYIGPFVSYTHFTTISGSHNVMGDSSNTLGAFGVNNVTIAAGDDNTIMLGFAGSSQTSLAGGTYSNTIYGSGQGDTITAGSVGNNSDNNHIDLTFAMTAINLRNTVNVTGNGNDVETRIGVNNITFTGDDNTYYSQQINTYDPRSGGIFDAGSNVSMGYKESLTISGHGNIINGGTSIDDVTVTTGSTNNQITLGGMNDSRLLGFSPIDSSISSYGSTVTDSGNDDTITCSAGADSITLNGGDSGSDQNVTINMFDSNVDLLKVHGVSITQADIIALSSRNINVNDAGSAWRIHLTLNGAAGIIANDQSLLPEQSMHIFAANVPSTDTASVASNLAMLAEKSQPKLASDDVILLSDGTHTVYDWSSDASGTTTISNFVSGQDHIDVSHLGLTKENIADHTTHNNGNIEITSDHVIISVVAVKSLDNSDFIFAA